MSDPRTTIAAALERTQDMRDQTDDDLATLAWDIPELCRIATEALDKVERRPNVDEWHALHHQHEHEQARAERLAAVVRATSGAGDFDDALAALHEGDLP